MKILDVLMDFLREEEVEREFKILFEADTEFDTFNEFIETADHDKLISCAFSWPNEDIDWGNIDAKWQDHLKHIPKEITAGDGILNQMEKPNDLFEL